MKRSKTLIFCVTLAATLIAHPVNANDTDLPDEPPIYTNTLKISTSHDLEMTCGELSYEASTMAQIISTTQHIKDNSQMKSNGITAAGTIGSFLIGSVTGGIGLAVGGFLLDHSIESNSDKADKTHDTAAQRRTLMVGVYNAKECFGPIENVMQSPDIFNTQEQIAFYSNNYAPHGTSTHYNN